MVEHGARRVRRATPMSSGDVTAWADEADVIVIGFGVAGACAAIEAAANGADVLVLERSSGWGGAAALASGFVYLGGGTPVQKACGFEDSPEDMYTFLTAAMGPGADEAKLALYAERSVEHFDWLVSCGVEFKSTFYDKPAWEPAGDHGLMYSGGENAYPFADLVRPAPRGHLPRALDRHSCDRSGGYMLMQPLAECVASYGVRVDYDTRFERLVIDPDGRVVGVVVTSFGDELVVRARATVVLASGGFAFDPDMLAREVPALAGRPGSAVESHDGQSIRAAQAVGASLAHMHAASIAVHSDPGLLVRSILVDAAGNRFINEDTYPGRIGQEMAFRRGNQAFVVADELGVDEAALDRPAGANLPPLQPTWVSDDVSELERQAGLPTGALRATLDYYNRHAGHGSDPQFHKSAHWVRPLRPPYGIFDLRDQTSGFPLGGLRTDVDGAVLDVDGAPIPGLRAAGRTAAGIGAGGYASGCSLGDGSFFGRRAGRAAAIDASRGQE